MVKLLLSVLLAVAMPIAIAMTNIWPSINFKPGHPAVGESLSDSLAPGAQSTLGEFVGALKRENGIYRVEGYADPGECRQVCEALSLRRARLVDHYLRERGLSSLLQQPVGFGSSQTIPAENIRPDSTNSRAQLQQIGGRRP